MMASGMLANDGEWNVGDRWRVECWQMMASEMLANADEWNVRECWRVECW